MLFTLCLINAYAQKPTRYYLSAGYTFARAPLKSFHEFIGLYNQDPNKIGNFTFSHGFDNMKCLKGIYLGGGYVLNSGLMLELNFTRKFNHTFAYYDPANNPNYLRVDIGYSIGTVEVAGLIPFYYTSGFTVAPGLGLGFVSRKLYYWDDEVLMITPKRNDMIVKAKSGSFSLDPMIQISYKPLNNIPVEIVARTYYQAMFSKMSVGWLGNFDGYWAASDTASKKVTGGNLGIVFAVRFNIPDFRIKPREKLPKDDPVIVYKPFVLNGIVSDSKNGMPIDAIVVLYDGTNPITSVISKNGKFEIKPELNVKYNIEFKAFGYKTKKEEIEFSTKSNNPYTYYVSLEKVEMGESIVLENILFEKASSVLLPESYVELDKLYKFMQEAPDINVEIAGHTSSDGDDNYNLKLSQDRANSVVTYLVNKGIAQKRLTAIGYGETKPVASNDNENGRKLNRRVEFKIIK